MTKRHWMEFAEYAAIASSVVGTVAAAVLREALYAAGPLTVAVAFNAMNRERLHRFTLEENSRLEMLVTPRLNALEGETQEFQKKAKQKITELRELVTGRTNEAVTTIYDEIDALTGRLEQLETQTATFSQMKDGLSNELQEFVRAYTQATIEELKIGSKKITERLDKLEYHSQDTNSQITTITSQLQDSLEAYRTATNEQIEKLAAEKVSASTPNAPDIEPIIIRLEQLEAAWPELQQQTDTEIARLKDYVIQETRAQAPVIIPPKDSSGDIKALSSEMRGFMAAISERLAQLELESRQREADVKKPDFSPPISAPEPKKETTPLDDFPDDFPDDDIEDMGDEKPGFSSRFSAPEPDVERENRFPTNTPNISEISEKIESSLGEAVHEIQDKLGSLLKGIVPPEVTGESDGVGGDNWQLIHTIKGHKDGINSVAVSPDGGMVASGDRDNTIKIWQLPTGKEIRTINGPDWFASVNSLAFSPNGKYLAAALADSIAIWQPNTGTEIRHIPANTESVSTLTFTPDSQLLISGDTNGNIKIWHWQTGQETTVIDADFEAVLALSISPNGQTIASGGQDAIVKLWRLETREPIVNLAGHLGAIFALAISPDGKIIASGSADKTIKLWQGETGEEIVTLTGHLGAVKCLAFSPDGQIIASGSVDKTIKIWDVQTGGLIATFKRQHAAVNCLIFSPDGKSIITGGDGKHLEIWQQN
ncbi:MAG: hypothetical protein Fur0025_47100 [Oscillatoriaceae cyanobacterium]